MSNLAPVIAKTWEFDENQIIQGSITITDEVQVDKKQLMFAIKTSMTNAVKFTTPWTTVQSSNGTTADATDNLTTEADFKWGSDSSGPSTAVRAWWLAHNAALGLYLLFDFSQNSSSSRGQRMDVYASSSAYNVDGTTTALPTATGDEIQIVDRLSSTNGSWEGNSTSNVARTYVLHVLMSDDGLETKVIINYDGTTTAFWSIGRAVGGPIVPTNNWFVSISPREATSVEISTVANWNSVSKYKFYVMTNAGARAECNVRTTRMDTLGVTWDEGFGVTPNAFDGRRLFQECILDSDTTGWEMPIGKMVDTWFGPVNQSHAKTWYSGKTILQSGEVCTVWSGIPAIPS